MESQIVGEIVANELGGHQYPLSLERCERIMVCKQLKLKYIYTDKGKIPWLRL